MGCGSSQQIQQPSEMEKKNENGRQSAKMKSNARVAPSVIRVASAAQSKTDKDKSPSDSGATSRNSSAISTSTEKSSDSGVGDAANLELEEAKGGRTFDMFVSRGPSGKVRSLDEAVIIEKLRNEGIISRPKSVANGMSFEIAVVEEPTISRRLPPRLARLENVQDERKSITDDDIKAKLAQAAERRRKKREAQRALSKPPRPPTRLADSTPDTGTLEVPIIHKSHPESELLVPPKEIVDVGRDVANF